MKPNRRSLRRTRVRVHRERKRRRRLRMESLEGRRLLATLTVNSTDDLVDLNPGDGVCEVSPGGACTLRAAIQEANASGEADVPDRIDIPPGVYNLSITGLGIAAGDLDVFQSVSIHGAGAAETIVDANGIDRVFDIASGTVLIQGLTIRGGLVDDPESLLDGTGGGIRNEGLLTLADSIVSGNRGTLGAGVGNYNGMLTIERSSITGNGDGATLGGGGVSNYSYYDPASTSISDSTISGNRARDGGGIRNYAYDGIASLTLTRSTVSDNSADQGAGILNRGAYYVEENVAANLTISNSTLSGNRASSNGGGLHSEAIEGSDSVITIQNSTIAENTATSGQGGGIYVRETSGTVTSLRSVIVGSNVASGTASDVFGEDVSAVFSLISDPDGHQISSGLSNNLVGIDAMLLPLADNGGLTETHSLAVASPAIDQGSNTGFVGDQRGSAFSRIFDDPAYPNADDGTDIGAVETGQVAAQFDFGDAPDQVLVGNSLRRYPTLLQSDGARHRVVPTGPKLGAVVPDPESDAVPSVMASGDDLIGINDEDGWNSDLIVLNPGQSLTGLSIAHDGGDGGGFLSLWADLNLDGDWDDNGEQLLEDVAVASGVGATDLGGITIPETAVEGVTFLRTRISTQAGLTPRGSALDGEVEDFTASIGQPPPAVADLDLTNVVSNPNPREGDEVSFTITVTNRGPERAGGVTISALLPFDLSYVSSQVSLGAYDDGNGVWTVNALKANESAQLIITATVETTDTVNFIAEVTSSDAADPDSTPGNGISGEDDQATVAIGTCLIAGPLHLGMNRLTYACTSPGAFTAFVRGTQRGAFTFEQYRTTVDIADAKEIAIGVADANGIAEAVFEVDEADLNGQFLFQAFEMFPRRHVTNTLRLSASSEELRTPFLGVGATPLNRGVLDASIAQAHRELRSIGLSPLAQSHLHSAEIVIADLPDHVLARAVGRTIILDSDAAGHGWFVDPTPWESSEFSGDPLVQSGTVAESATRIDLLTTLVHEFGHLIGLEHVEDPNHVMNESLPPGVRRRLIPNQNHNHRFDVNADNDVTSLDALLVINRLNQATSESDGNDALWLGNEDGFFDTNGDYRITALDALLVVNHLGDRSAEGENLVASTEFSSDEDTARDEAEPLPIPNPKTRPGEKVIGATINLQDSTPQGGLGQESDSATVVGQLQALDELIELMASDPTRCYPLASRLSE